MNVKLLDLDRQYRKIKNEVMREVKAVCDSQHYVLGPNVKALEEEIAAYSGAKYAVGVASGTDAILLALMAAGVGPGDRVVTTPYTFFSTAGSIALLGAVPVFVDIEPDTFNIDPNALERLLKKSAKNVKAVMPVHLYGQCAEMDTIRRLAHRHNLMVIEDAAQSIGARYKGRAAGALGDFGCFSFYPTKNLGCFGDGGMVTTNSKQRAEKLRMLRGHGSRRRYYYDIVGTNSRLDEVQAAVLAQQLRQHAELGIRHLRPITAGAAEHLHPQPSSLLSARRIASRTNSSCSVSRRRRIGGTARATPRSARD